MSAERPAPAGGTPAVVSPADYARECVESFGFKTDIIDSPILGAEGNREFLLYARPHAKD